jgi:SNF2 family DNA or RNA helicase
MTDPMFQYQDDFVGKLVDTSRLFGGLDAGLGKSRCVIEAAKRIGAKRVLLPGPAICKVSWPAEVAKWWPEAACHVPPEPALLVAAKNAPCTFNVISYDDMARAPIQWIDAAREHKPEIVAPDEAHRLSNLGAMRTKVVYGPRGDLKTSICENADFIWPLSGTPARNFTSELWSHLRALAPQTIKSLKTGRPMSEGEFRDRYSTMRASVHGMHVTGSVHTEELRERTKDFFFRLRKKDVLKDLPDLLWTHEPLPFTADAGSIINEVELPTGLSDDALLEWLSGAFEHLATLRRALGLAKVNGAIEWVRTFMKNTDRKLILFAYHTDVCEALHRALGPEFGSVMIHGGTPLATRRTAVHQFQNGSPRLFVGETLACGEVLTLTAASDVAFVEGDWTPTNLYQAASRAHRLTQTRGVIARLLYVPNSLDERIARVAATKTRELDVMFNTTSN